MAIDWKSYPLQGLFDELIQPGGVPRPAGAPLARYLESLDPQALGAARDNLQSGLSKRGRYAYLRGIFSSVYGIAGVLDGTMNHGVGYDFMQIGRDLERADMTTRIVDVRSASLLPEETARRRPFENIQWVSVLNSLSAYQMYRRSMQVRVRRARRDRQQLLPPPGGWDSMQRTEPGSLIEAMP